jgi:hypothetical protein
MVTVVAVAFSLPFHPWPLSPQTPDPGRSCSDALVSDDEDGATQEPGESLCQSVIKEAGHPTSGFFICLSSHTVSTRLGAKSKTH